MIGDKSSLLGHRIGFSDTKHLLKMLAPWHALSKRFPVTPGNFMIEHSYQSVKLGISSGRRTCY